MFPNTYSLEYNTYFNCCIFFNSLVILHVNVVNYSENVETGSIFSFLDVIWHKHVFALDSTFYSQQANWGIEYK